MTKRCLFLLIISIFVISCSNPPPTTPEQIDSGTDQSIQINATDTLFIQLGKIKSDFDSENERQNNKLKIIDDRTKYIDSVYFELVTQISKIESDVNELKNRSSDARLFNGNNNRTISDEEFRKRYIEALANYQNGNYDASIKEFGQLLSLDYSHDLSDNCQYWIGEIHYARKDFRKALNAFIKTLEFPSTNKADHAQYKIGLCYLNIGDVENAVDAFKIHISKFPNSEHYKSSVEYINNNK